ncbi:hypothetical protein AB0D92_25295 [Streptomyces parvus]
MAGFTETDPATGEVGVGVDRTVVVFDTGGTLVHGTGYRRHQ